MLVSSVHAKHSRSGNTHSDKWGIAIAIKIVKYSKSKHHKQKYLHIPNTWDVVLTLKPPYQNGFINDNLHSLCCSQELKIFVISADLENDLTHLTSLIMDCTFHYLVNTFTKHFYEYIKERWSCQFKIFCLVKVRRSWLVKQSYKDSFT